MAVFSTLRCDNPDCESFVTADEGFMYGNQANTVTIPAEWCVLTRGEQVHHFCSFPCVASWAAERSQPPRMIVRDAE